MSIFERPVAFPDVESGPIRQWAGSLRSMVQHLERGRTLTADVARAADTDWDGAAADQFARAAEGRREDLLRVAEAARGAAPVLDEYAAIIDSATSQYEHAVGVQRAAYPELPETLGVYLEAIAAQTAAAGRVTAAGTICAAQLAGMEVRLTVADAFDDLGDGIASTWDGMAEWPFPDVETTQGTILDVDQPILDCGVRRRFSEYSLEGDLTIPLRPVGVRLGGDLRAMITEYQDGTTSVAVTLTGSLAASSATRRAGAELYGGVEGSRTTELTFRTRDEADQFLAQMRDAIVPTGREMLRGVGATSAIGADAADDARAVLDHYRGNVTKDAWSGGVLAGGAAEIDELLSVDGAARAGYAQENGSGRLYVEIEGAIDARDGLGFAMDGSGTSRAEIELENGRAARLVITSSTDVLAGGELTARTPGAPAELNVESGGRTETRVTVNLADPANAAAARQFLIGASARDVAAMARSLPGLYDGSQVLVENIAVGRGEIEGDLPGDLGGARLGTDVGYVGSAIVKEPYSRPQQYQPPGR